MQIKNYKSRKISITFLKSYSMFRFLIIIILISLLLSYHSVFVDNQNCQSTSTAIDQNTEPSVSLPSSSVTPRTGDTEDKFLFLIIYRDLKNIPPVYIRLIIDDERYDLKPLDIDDLNYSNGKNYFIKLELLKGVHIYYFETSNGNNSINTLASTLIVSDVPNEYTHLDVAYSVLFGTLIIMIVLIYGIFQLRNLSQSIKSFLRTNEEKNKNYQLKEINDQKVMSLNQDRKGLKKT